MNKAERKRRQKIRAEKHREKMIAEGKKQYNFYLDKEAQEKFESIKDALLTELGKADMTLSETFTEILGNYIDNHYNIDYLKSKIKEREEEHTKYSKKVKCLIDLYESLKAENESLKEENSKLKAL